MSEWESQVKTNYTGVIFLYSIDGTIKTQHHGYLQDCQHACNDNAYFSSKYFLWEDFIVSSS